MGGATHKAGRPFACEQPAAESGKRSDEERPLPAVRKLAEQDVLDALQQNGTEDGRQQQVEREASSAVAVELHEAAGGDRDARA